MHALGILEAYKYSSANMDNDDLGEATITQTWRFAWASTSLLLPNTTTGDRSDEKHEIWQHSTITIEPFHDSVYEDAGPLRKDLTPMQAIVYDETNVTAIEVMLVPNGTVKSGRGDVVRHIKSIIGIRMRLADETRKQPWSSIGDFPLPEEYQRMYGREYHDYVHRFDIDGPSNECLVSIGAEIWEGLSAVRFRTNRGRDMIFGSESGNDSCCWHDFPTTSNLRMVGFVWGFATIGCPREPKQNTRLTCITALNMER